MTTLLDVQMDLLRAAETVLALDERLATGEAVPEAEYDAAMVPFKELSVLAKDKVDRWAGFRLYLEPQREHFKKLADLNAKRAKAIENLMSRLDNAALFAIHCTDANYLEGNERRLTAHKNSQDALVIKHTDMLPDSCFKTEVVKVIDKEAVRAGIKAGEIVPSVAELTRGEHLRIK